jgi:hypothetical protein
MKKFISWACLTLSLLYAAQVSHAQNRAVLSRAAALLKKVPPRATLAQLKKLMPKGTKWDAPGTTSISGWNFVAQPFRGPLNGQFIFANQRKVPARKPGAPPLPPFMKAQPLLAADGFHYAEIFLGPDVKSEKKGALTAFTKRYVEALSKPLGRTASRENTGEEGGPDAEGWAATWKFSGERLIEFNDTFPLLADGPRPILTLQFPYSKIYKP